MTDDYLEKAEQKLTAGDVGRVEALRAKVEALKAANTLRAVAADADIARARLNYQLARGRNDPILITGKLEIPFSDLDLESFAGKPRDRALNFAGFSSRSKGNCTRRKGRDSAAGRTWISTSRVTGWKTSRRPGPSR